ncbi:hypothetical protein MPLSOD_40599 [Mesorhizobium sp. SOD10]|nr:hypothetical protein MPLSOD_40599 [Mesorhizobium sp. SOD10]
MSVRSCNRRRRHLLSISLLLSGLEIRPLGLRRREAAGGEWWDKRLRPTEGEPAAPHKSLKSKVFYRGSP